MKQTYAFLIAAFYCILGNAQVVDIPDADFKSKLLNDPQTIDLNEDGEIDVEEAALVTNLTFSYCDFDNVIGIQAFVNLQSLTFGSYMTIASPIDLSGMASLTSLRFTKCSFSTANLAGLNNLESLSVGYGGDIDFLNMGDLVNLKTISFYETHISALDLTNCSSLKTFIAQETDLDTLILDGLTNLESFKLRSNNGNLTHLDLSDLTSLTYFEASNTHLTSINFDQNTLLEEILFTENQFINNLDFSSLTNLTKLNCYDNQLTSINVSQNTNLRYLNCSDNQLTSIDVSNLRKLKQVDVSRNLFTTLDFSGLTDCVESNIKYYIDHNPNLIRVDIKNGKEDLVWSDDLHCPNLVYMCLDEIDMPDQGSHLQQEGITDIEFNTYCTFVPGGDYNTITGTISFDANNNGYDVNDYKLPWSKLTTTNNNGAFTNDAGQFNCYTQSGDFTITPVFENPYFTVSPASVTLSFSDDDNNIQTQNFSVTPNGIHKDVTLTLIPVHNAKPGFDAAYRLVYENKGNQQLSGTIALAFEDAVLDFVAANPTSNSQATNILNWNYNNLLPFEKRTIDLTFHLNPAVNNGDILQFTATINPVSDDEMTSDNTFTLAQTIAGSFNSNDKTCLEGSTITTNMVGDYLHYLIRFQNSGTATTESIVVKDIIDTDKFDVSSLQIISTSHAQVTKITGNKVEFQFENINLPTENEDALASQGYVAFKIKTKDNLEVGDSVANKASIYFDYNFPIETNTATSTIALLGLNTFENTSVTIAPNPTKGMVKINSKDKITSIQLFDLQGRIIRSSTANTLTTDFDLSQQTTGIYFLKIYTLKGVKVEKIMKE